MNGNHLLVQTLLCMLTCSRASTCSQDTGGTCLLGWCDASRHASCVDGKCMCPDGMCANASGVCSSSGVTGPTTAPTTAFRSRLVETGRRALACNQDTGVACGYGFCAVGQHCEGNSWEAAGSCYCTDICFENGACETTILNCDLIVNAATSGSSTCGVIQSAVDRAHDSATVCVTEGGASVFISESDLSVSAGTYNCCGGWAAKINRSITLRGLGAGPLIDCAGSGGAFHAHELDTVVIENFRVQNTNGKEAGRTVKCNATAVTKVWQAYISGIQEMSRSRPAPSTTATARMPELLPLILILKVSGS